MKLALTFDDVLLVPKHSSVMPSEVSVRSRFTKNVFLNIPISSSAMDTVTETSMAAAMHSLGGIGVIHKNNSIADQSSMVQALMLSNPQMTVAAAVGVTPDWRVRVESLISANVKVLVLDSAHGHSDNIMTLSRTIKRDYPDVQLVAGNVATYDGAMALCECGVDAVKVGIGPGSICTTRIVSGVGIPQLTAIENAVAACDKYDVPVIADGGIRNSADLVKALAIGADCTMIGSLFAGTDQSPGVCIEQDGRKYKSYRGMGSIAAMEKGSKDRYFQSNQRKLVAEGVESLVPYKGSVESIVDQLIGGLKSGLGYTGSRTISDLHSRAEFVQITNAGLKESHVHDVIQ